jgi:hypothetical protein
VPGDAESGARHAREVGRTRSGATCDEEVYFGQCTRRMRGRRRTTASRLRVLGERLGNSRFSELLPRTCAMNRATPGQVSTATPRRGIELPGADAKREVRSRYDSQVARVEPYAKSRDLATVPGAIQASRCRKLAGIAPLSTSASFATVQAERIPRRIYHAPGGAAQAVIQSGAPFRSSVRNDAPRRRPSASKRLLRSGGCHCAALRSAAGLIAHGTDGESPIEGPVRLVTGLSLASRRN